MAVVKLIGHTCFWITESTKRFVRLSDEFNEIIDRLR